MKNFLITCMRICFFLVVSTQTMANNNQDSKRIYDVKTGSKIVGVSMILDEVRKISVGRGDFVVVGEVLLNWNDSSSTFRAGSTDSQEITLTGTRVDDYFMTEWAPEFFIANAESPREPIIRSLTLSSDGKVELFEKFKATVAMDTSIPSYPFGELDLQINIEAVAHPVDELIFDIKQFSLGHTESKHEVIKGNWHQNGSNSEVTTTKSLRHGHNEFSNAKFHLIAEHDFVDVAQKIFIPLLSVILLALVINKYCVIYETESGGDNGNWRIGGQLTLLLTLFALKFSLGEEIPQTHYLTLVDALFLSAGVLVVAALVWGIMVIYFFQAGQTKLAYKLEHNSNIVFSLLTVGLLAWTFSFALR